MNANILIAQTPTSEEWEYVRDVETVRSASKEMLKVLREIVSADNKMVAITKAKTLVDKLPEL